MKRIFSLITVAFVLIPALLYSDSEKVFFGLTSNSNDSIVVIDLMDVSSKLRGLNDSLGVIAIKEAFHRITSNSDKELLGRLHASEGVHYLQMERLPESIKSLKSSLGHLDKSPDRIFKAEVMLSLGKSYRLADQFDKALLYLESAKSEFTDISEKKGLAKCIYEIGLTMLGKDNKSDAVSSFNNSLEIANSIQESKLILLNSIELLRISLLEDEIGEVFLKNLNDKLYYSQETYNLEAESELYNLLAAYYSKTNNYDSAYLMANSSIQASNELTKLKSQNLSIILTEIAPVEKKESSIGLSTVVIYVLITILVCFILFLLYRLKQLKRNHNTFIDNCTKEIKAFNSSITDLESKIDEESGSRVDELNNELERAKQNKISLLNSQNNLIEVNRLKDVFLSKISHEIRTPLSTILGFAEILENQFAMLEENDMFDYARSITDSGQSLVSLLNNILDISKLNSNEFELSIEKKNPSEILRDVIGKYQKEAEIKGVKIIHDIKKSPELHTDSVVLTKIVSSIIDNSVKFTEKGFIKVSLHFEERDEKILISIKDTGIGIDKVYLDQVFEPYRQESLGYSTSYQGAGLGLPLAKKMTTKLSGSIQLESEKGSGTVVNIEFPIIFTEIKEGNKTAETIEHSTSEVPEEDGATNTPETENKTRLPWESLTILVVEDDSMNQLLFEKMLKKARKLEIAKDGKTALSIIEKRSEDFDVVLMDINLPPPWTGITLQKEIRAKYPEFVKVPFIAQTAYAMSGNREQMLEEGFDEYITKPISKKILIDVINKVIP